jgi:hypothetical protein
LGGVYQKLIRPVDASQRLSNPKNLIPPSPGLLFRHSVRPIKQYSPSFSPQAGAVASAHNKNTIGSCSLDLRVGGEEPESGKKVRG